MHSKGCVFSIATRVESVGEVTGIEEMERRLVELVEQVEREKEKTRDTPKTTHYVGCKGRSTVERTGRSCCRYETGVEGEERSSQRVTSV